MSFLRRVALAETEIVGLKPIKIMDFPEARQSTNFSCGVASVQAVLYYYGIDLREDKLIKTFSAQPTDIIHSGVDPEDLKDKLETKWGLKVEMAVGMNIEDLKEYANKYIPVIIAIQAWRGEDGAVENTDYSAYKDGHYVVSIGYTDKQMIFEDPSILTNRGYLSFEDLETRWHDADYHGNKYEHLGLAVYGRKPTFNPKSFKKIL